MNRPHHASDIVGITSVSAERPGDVLHHATGTRRSLRKTNVWDVFGTKYPGGKQMPAKAQN